MRWITLGIAFWLLGPAAALAEEETQAERKEGRPARSFAELQDDLQIGDTVHILDADGEVLKGKIEDFGFESLAVGDLEWRGNERRESGVDRQTFTEEKIRRLELEVRDSLTSGALIGLGAGASIGFLAGAGYDIDMALLAAAFYGGIGAAIGAGLDAINKKRIVLYERPRGRSTLELDVAPVLSHDKTGVQLYLRFLRARVR